MDIYRTFVTTIEDYHLLKKGEAVLVALSGGPDSVALLHMLSRLRKKMNLTLGAVYVNHQIRKKAAFEEEQFCQQLCDKLGIELDIAIEDIPALAKKKKMSVEEAARMYRYELFEALAEEAPYDKIALGHHADDRVETVLFRLFRGTGSAGMVGIPIKRDRYIRPLFFLTKKQILEYLKKHRLKYRTDQSNLQLKYSRNYIRNKLLPEIRKQLNPRVDEAVLNFSELLTDEEAFLETMVARTVKKIVGITVGGKFEVALDKFNSYDVWLKRRIIRYLLQSLSRQPYPPEKETVDRLIGFSQGRGKAVSLPQKIQAELVNGKLVLFYRRTINYRARLEPGKQFRLKELKLNLRFRVNEINEVRLEKNRRAMKVTLDFNRVKPPLEIRNLKPGDRFQPLGLKGTKKIGDYLTDRKVPRVFRDEIPVVVDSEGVIWLVGFEIADRVKIDSQTEKVAILEVSQRRQRKTPGL